MTVFDGLTGAGNADHRAKTNRAAEDAMQRIPELPGLTVADMISETAYKAVRAVERTFMRG